MHESMAFSTLNYDDCPETALRALKTAALCRKLEPFLTFASSSNPERAQNAPIPTLRRRNPP
jgi:hypothetical protein